MAQADPLAVALAQVEQSFADFGVVIGLIRQLRTNAARLQPMRADELRG